MFTKVTLFIQFSLVCSQTEKHESADQLIGEQIDKERWRPAEIASSKKSLQNEHDGWSIAGRLRHENSQYPKQGVHDGAGAWPLHADSVDEPYLKSLQQYRKSRKFHAQCTHIWNWT